jgi:hypothetical protein
VIGGKEHQVVYLRGIVALALTTAVWLSGSAAYDFWSSLPLSERPRASSLPLTGATFVIGPFVALLVARLSTTLWGRGLRVTWNSVDVLGWTWLGVIAAVPVAVVAALGSRALGMPIPLHQRVVFLAALLAVFGGALAGSQRGIRSDAPLS